MDNFFTGNKQSSNYSRTYSKGKSFKFSVWNSKDTYNNDEFVQDFVQWDKTLWAAKKTSTNILPKEGEYWELIVKGVSDIEFRQVDNRIEYRYIDPTSEWKDLFELASVSEDQIRKMLEDLDIKYGNTYDVKLSETSTNAVQNQVVTKKFKELDDKNTKTESELTNIKSSVNTALSNSKSYTDSKISETKTQIDSELNKKANQTDVNEVVDVLNENINLKVDKVSGKGLSTNDFNNNYKSKLDNLDSSLNSTLTSAKSYTNSEITKVDNKINSEISRAKTSETNLSNRIDGLEEDVIEALNEAKEYTDTLANGEVKNNTNKLNILNGTGEGSVIKTVKDEISYLVGTAPEKLDTLQEIADYLEEHEDMASGLVNSLSELETKKADKTELTNLKTETDSALQSLEKSKANTTGYYPQMAVGFADDLVGRGESVPAEFSFRASGGKSIKDGTARIKRLKGNSVVWNQLVSDKMYLSTSKYEGQVVGGKYVGKNKGAMLAQNLGIVIKDYYTIIGHKYLWIFTCSDANCSANVGNKYGLNSGVITEATSVGYLSIYPYGATNKTIEAGTEFELTAQVHDLTQMFGAGNEPTTIEEFNARKPIVEDEHAYNEGEVIHMTAEGIKSVGDNAWDEQWNLKGVRTGTGAVGTWTDRLASANFIPCIPNESYHCSFPVTGWYIFFYDKNYQYIGEERLSSTVSEKTIVTPSNAAYMKFSEDSADYGTTYNNDIMITLVHSGWKQDTDAGYQPYWEDRLIFDQRIKDEFPDGLQKWDMVYNKNGKGYIVKGTGVVDMGDLNWAIVDSTIPNIFHAQVNNIVIPSVSSEYIKGLLSTKYGLSNSGNIVNMPDKSMLRYNGYIYIYDVDYSSVSTFKEAMAGVMLYYQLAEPIIIEYDEPFNLDYRVADFGTEQAIAEQPSAPISADIIYQFNAVDMIREHELEIEELKTTIVNLQTLITQLQTSISSMGG